jgi:hypothetical protein
MLGHICDQLRLSVESQDESDILAPPPSGFVTSATVYALYVEYISGYGNLSLESQECRCSGDPGRTPSGRTARAVS